MCVCLSVCARGRGFRSPPLLNTYYVVFFYKVESRVHLIKRDPQTQIRVSHTSHRPCSRLPTPSAFTVTGHLSIANLVYLRCFGSLRLRNFKVSCVSAAHLVFTEHKVSGKAVGVIDRYIRKRNAEHTSV